MRFSNTLLGIHAIGEGYSQLAGTMPKHGIKQVDRLASNPAYDIWRLLKPWATFILGRRKEIVLALDWTDFDDDDQTTLTAYVITEHGRATPMGRGSASGITVRRHYRFTALASSERVPPATPRAWSSQSHCPGRARTQKASSPHGFDGAPSATAIPTASLPPGPPPSPPSAG